MNGLEVKVLVNETELKSFDDRFLRFIITKVSADSNNSSDSVENFSRPIDDFLVIIEIILELEFQFQGTLFDFAKSRTTKSQPTFSNVFPHSLIYELQRGANQLSQQLSSDMQRNYVWHSPECNVITHFFLPEWTLNILSSQRSKMQRKKNLTSRECNLIHSRTNFLIISSHSFPFHLSDFMLHNLWFNGIFVENL